MGIEILVFDENAEQRPCRLEIPGPEHTVLISRDTEERTHRRLWTRMRSGHIDAEFFDDEWTVAVPGSFELLKTPEAMRSKRATSEAVYMFETYFQVGSVRYGILGQLLKATHEPNCVHPHRQRHRSAFTSCHTHPLIHPECPPLYEIFCPAFGACHLWTNDSINGPLTKQTLVVPGVFHQLQCDTVAFNLLCMYHLPEPYRVRDAPHVVGQRHLLVAQKLMQSTAA